MMEKIDYRSKLLKEVTHKLEPERIYSSLDEVYEEINRKEPPTMVPSKKHKALLEVREETYKILDAVQSYWSAFGFFDKSPNMHSIVANLTKHVAVVKNIDNNDDDNNDAHCDEGDDIFAQK